MGFTIPTEVWALFGISVGSTAGPVIVKGSKQPQQPDASKVSSKLAKAAPSVMHDNPNNKDAKLRDMFMGEEVTDFEYVDISKVQMFFFTIAAVLGYFWALSSGTGELPSLINAAEAAAKLVEGYSGSDPAALELLQKKAEAAQQAAFGLPMLSTQLVTILGISHVGYLTVKAAPKTPTV
jgi:hypothetical protein